MWEDWSFNETLEELTDPGVHQNFVAFLHDFVEDDVLDAMSLTGSVEADLTLGMQVDVDMSVAHMCELETCTSDDILGLTPKSMHVALTFASPRGAQLKSGAEEAVAANDMDLDAYLLRCPTKQRVDHDAVMAAVMAQFQSSAASATIKQEVCVVVLKQESPCIKQELLGYAMPVCAAAVLEPKARSPKLEPGVASWEKPAAVVVKVEQCEPKPAEDNAAPATKTATRAKCVTVASGRVQKKRSSGKREASTHAPGKPKKGEGPYDRLSEPERFNVFYQYALDEKGDMLRSTKQATAERFFGTNSSNLTSKVKTWMYEVVVPRLKDSSLRFTKSISSGRKSAVLHDEDRARLKLEGVITWEAFEYKYLKPAPIK